MKKLLSLILALVMVLALCACGNDPVDTPVVTGGEAETTTVPETTGHVHVFSDATCLEPATCSCGATEGEPIDHLFEDATCDLPMTCSVCNATEGDPLGHVYTDASCIEPAACVLCGETDGVLASHSYEAGSCIVCGDLDPDYMIYDEGEE